MPAPGEPVRRSPVLSTDQRAHALGSLTTEMFSKECSGQLYSCCYPVQVVFVPKRVLYRYCELDDIHCFGDLPFTFRKSTCRLGGVIS
jgi:hypothetical protein